MLDRILVAQETRGDWYKLSFEQYCSRTNKPAPPPLPGIEWKERLKLLGINFHKHPCNWDLRIDSLLSTAARRLYILRVSKYYVYTKDQLS